LVEPKATVEQKRKSSWRHHARTLAAGLAIFVAGVAVGRQQGSQAATPVDFRLGGRALEAIGPGGTVLWTHRFDRIVTEISGSAPRLSAQFLDVDGDDEAEILAFVRFAQPGRPPTISDGLFCFRRDGTLKWRVMPDHTLSFGEEIYSAPWRIQDFVASEGAGPRRLWIALAHHTWWPSFVLEIDGAGTGHIRYVQAGRIFSLAHWTTPAGGVLAVGGVTHERSEASLALLRDGDPAASFPGRRSGTYGCRNCPDALPNRVLLFAAAAHARLFPRQHPFVTNLAVTGAELKVSLDVAVQPPGMHAVATIGPNQVPRSVRFSDGYWRIHRELEQAQRIHHTVEHCPDRHQARIVREWTSEGWRELQVEGEPSAE
jgi:hypothetical protein